VNPVLDRNRYIFKVTVFIVFLSLAQAHPSDSRLFAVWVATRSLSKATYPGRLDQFVAGGQPSSMTLLENVKKECAEEASLPPEVRSLYMRIHVFIYLFIYVYIYTYIYTHIHI